MKWNRENHSLYTFGGCQKEQRSWASFGTKGTLDLGTADIGGKEWEVEAEIRSTNWTLECHLHNSILWIHTSHTCLYLEIAGHPGICLPQEKKEKKKEKRDYFLMYYTISLGKDNKKSGCSWLQD